MIKGLERFRTHFAGYEEQYVLIGGVALWLLMTDAGLDPRATKDLDIVLVVEALDPAFVKAFWAFIQAGRYQVQERSDGTKVFYRFAKPQEDGYPAMLELFSRRIDTLPLPEAARITRIPAGEEISSLSAILMDDDYYSFMRENVRVLEGVPVITEACLVPFKACAWLDLTARCEAGERIDSKDIDKHRKDVVRAFQLIPPDLRIELPAQIATDMARFLERVAPQIDAGMLASLGLRNISPEDVLASLRSIYMLA